MGSILNARLRHVTLSAGIPAFTLIALISGLAACSSPPSGGGGGVLCALDGSCPAGMTCGGQFCTYPIDGTATATDTAAGGEDGAGVVDSGAIKDTGALPDTSKQPDSAQPDVVKPDTMKPDTMKPDTAQPDTMKPDTTQPDTATDTSGTTTTGIAALQSAQSSKICGQMKGELSIAKDMTLTGAVVTADAAKLGKLMVFYVRPQQASATDGRWQGLKVVVFGGPTSVKAGDIVSLTGEVVEYYCETEIKVAADKISVTGKANLPPSAYAVVAAEVAGKGLQSEPYEGVFVELANVEVVEPNVLGTDGKTHGQFAVAPAGQTTPLVVIGGTSGTSFTVKNSATGQIETTMKKGQVFKAIRAHLTYSFETYVLRPSTDADLVAQ